MQIGFDNSESSNQIGSNTEIDNAEMMQIMRDCNIQFEIDSKDESF